MPVRGLVYACLACASVYALFDTGEQYGGFEIPQVGVYSIHPDELAFLLWYAIWGGAATLFATLALMETRAATWMPNLVRAIAQRPTATLVVAAALALLLPLGVRSGVLLHEPIADDESTYLFQAQTLLRGGFVNPVPDEPAFYENQFVLINEHGWFGKYPPGHPMVLALGEALGLTSLVMPLFGALTVLLAYAVGKRWFSRERALWGAVLLVVSPQFLTTQATLLSQPTAACLLLSGIWGVTRMQEEKRLSWGLFAGVVLGLLFLARPMPGAMFIAVLGAHVAFVGAPAEGGARGEDHLHLLRRRGAWLASLLPGLLLGVGLLALSNHATSGSIFKSGYELAHRGYGVLKVEGGRIPTSLAGALLRQNFWLFGWFCSLLFLPFARPRRGALLLWGLITAEYAYRVLVPKTVVSTTGPVYVYEIVPLLALASADGAANLVARLRAFGVQRPKALVSNGVLAASAVALVTFVPVQLRAMYTSSEFRARAKTFLARRGVERALVFTNALVAPERGVTWAYFPPNPSPGLDDDVLFVREPEGQGGASLAYTFWQKHFPERRAFRFSDGPAGARLHELSPANTPPPGASLAEFVAGSRLGAGTPKSTRTPRVVREGEHAEAQPEGP